MKCKEMWLWASTLHDMKTKTEKNECTRPLETKVKQILWLSKQRITKSHKFMENIWEISNHCGFLVTLLEIVGQFANVTFVFTHFWPIWGFFFHQKEGRCKGVCSDWTVCIFNIWSIFYFAVLLFQSVLDFTEI